MGFGDVAYGDYTTFDREGCAIYRLSYFVEEIYVGSYAPRD